MAQHDGFNMSSRQPSRGNVDTASPPGASALSSSTGLRDPHWPPEQPPLFVRFECEHSPWLPSADEEADTTGGLLGTASDGHRTNTMPRRQPYLKPRPVDSSHSLSSALKAYPAALSSLTGPGMGDGVNCGDQKKTVLRVVATTVPTAVSSRGTEAAKEVTNKSWV